ncbi:MAG: GNAT family N-acetyltransferase [Bifidobacteriaceae bacterium]|jgi:ribosomal protein S18 acetylase RimI-like enzyme|nr:GNAT family N-acetyltransferase [Bifidobacteriaceae bacterium]
MARRERRLGGGLRVLPAAEVPDAARFAEAAGPQGVLAGARIAELLAGPGGWGEVWASGAPGDLRAICWFGGAMIPVAMGPEHCGALAAAARTRSRGCASIVGDAATVLGVWSTLSRWWPRPREVRPDQPLLELAGAPRWTPDPEVRRARPEELDSVLPASVAMFTEELGFPPAAEATAYRRRVIDLIARGHTYVRFAPGAATGGAAAEAGGASGLGGAVGSGGVSGLGGVSGFGGVSGSEGVGGFAGLAGSGGVSGFGEVSGFGGVAGIPGGAGGTRAIPSVAFKADLGAVIGRNAQVHGVWVRPDLRRRGLARAGVSAVAGAALAGGMRSLSLYVNAYNTPALACYRAVGFRQVGTWATVMF